MKIDTSCVRSLDPDPPDLSPDRKLLPPLIQTQTPVVPGTPNQNPLNTEHNEDTPAIPESTFNLETDFFSNTKTKVPIMSLRETLQNSRISRRSQKITKEIEVQTDLEMLRDFQTNSKKISFHELSMIDLPSVD